MINNEIISENKFPLVLGGEHSITPGSIKPFTEKYSELTISILSGFIIGTLPTIWPWKKIDQFNAVR